MNTLQRPLLLLVDDDPLITDALGYALGKDFEIVTSATRPQACPAHARLRSRSSKIASRRASCASGALRRMA